MTMTARQHPTPIHEAIPLRHGRPAANPEIKYRADAASYVAAMLAELRQISGKAGFDKLVGVLDAAYYEAYALIDAKNGSALQASEKTSAPPEPTRL